MSREGGGYEVATTQLSPRFRRKSLVSRYLKKFLLVNLAKVLDIVMDIVMDEFNRLPTFVLCFSAFFCLKLLQFLVHYKAKKVSIYRLRIE